MATSQAVGTLEQQAEQTTPSTSPRVWPDSRQHGIGEVAKQISIGREGGEDQSKHRQTQQQGGGPAAGNPSKIFHETTEVDGLGPI
jgi:hypothetical protein